MKPVLLLYPKPPVGAAYLLAYLRNLNLANCHGNMLQEMPKTVIFYGAGNNSGGSTEQA